MTSLRESTARTRELGAELRRVREAARYTGKELAWKLGWSPSKVSRMETGDRGTSEMDAAVYAAFCGAIGDDLHRLLGLAQVVDDNHWLQVRGERLPDELRSLIALETTAEIITYYEPLVIPGLLQIEDYARAVFRETGVLPAESVESRVRIRMDRQRLLNRRNPPEVTFFVHENALRTPVGNIEIMHEQILHLLLAGAAPPCQLRVVPASSGARTGLTGAFIWMAHRAHNPVIYVEHLTTSLFLEGRDEVLAYRRRLEQLQVVALDVGQSRAYLAALASEYDREEGEHVPSHQSDHDVA
ncbi:MAG: helix-turn-helix domain-containing protein [Labedaea sp.]